MDNLKLWVWLAIKQHIDAHKISTLLGRFGSIEAIYDADLFANIDGITHADKINLLSKSLYGAEIVMEKIDQLGARIVTIDSDEYPEMLKSIHSPPYLLYMKGKRLDVGSLSIGVIGSRECTDYGKVATEVLCRDLASSGVTIVSGMARGIDAIASISALNAGGNTIAVIGSGIDVCYPPENEELMEELFQNGLVITEYPPGSAPLGYHFPKRNRIISGLSKGILVTEAAKHSGTFTTVQRAIELGKPVFAVPGGIFHPQSEGTNMLIKRGARITTSAYDIFAQFPDDVKKLKRADGQPVDIKPPKPKPTRKKSSKKTKKEAPVPAPEPKPEISIDDERYKGLSENERKAMELLIEKEMRIDDISRASGLNIQTLNSVLPMLELSGYIRKTAAGIYRIVI